MKEDEPAPRPEGGGHYVPDRMDDAGVNVMIGTTAYWLAIGGVKTDDRY